MKNPFIAAVFGAAVAIAGTNPFDRFALQVPTPRKRKGKARANVKSITSNRQQRRIYSGKYMPHQGRLECCRRANPTAWSTWRGFGTNREQHF